MQGNAGKWKKLYVENTVTHKKASCLLLFSVIRLKAVKEAEDSDRQ